MQPSSDLTTPSGKVVFSLSELRSVIDTPRSLRKCASRETCSTPTFTPTGRSAWTSCKTSGPPATTSARCSPRSRASSQTPTAPAQPTPRQHSSTSRTGRRTTGAFASWRRRASSAASAQSAARRPTEGGAPPSLQPTRACQACPSPGRAEGICTEKQAALHLGPQVPVFVCHAHGLLGFWFRLPPHTPVQCAGLVS